MSPLKGLSMRWKLVLTSALIEALMLGALTWNGLRLMDESLQRQAATRLSEISVLLNAALGPAMATQDYAPVADVFKQSLQPDGIQYFVLTDPRGKRLLSDSWQDDAALPTYQTQIDPHTTAERADLRIPITLSGQTYGYLHFGISTHFLLEARQHLTRQSLIIAVLAIALSLFLLFAVAHWLTRHLNRLQRASDAVAKGDFSMLVNIDTRDEIGKLGKAFNHMTQHIGEQLAKLTASEARFKSLLNLSTDLYWEQDAHFRFQPRDTSRMPPETQALYALMAGKQPWELNTTLTPDDWARHKKALSAYETFRDFEYGIRHPDGSTSFHRVHGEPVFDAAKNFSGYRGTSTDITVFKQQQEKLEALAHYDALTRLPNRVLLADRLTHGLRQATRDNELLAIAYLDLDGFKPVNDSLGHEAGDQLLIEVANRLRACVRSSDTAARLGGDEFVLLLRAEDFGECEAALLRVLNTLGSEFQISGQSVFISASIGVTVFPHDNADADVLLRHADQAMYLAKQSGRNRYHFFDSELDQRQQNEQELINRIESALDADEFVLFYQPKVDMRSGQVFGAEALIRWQHPERGIVSPAEFLPLIEESDFSVKLGVWVVKTAMAQLKIWEKTGLTVTISVNITPRHIQSPGFVQQLRKLFETHPNVLPATLEMEIVESAALEDIQMISGIMRECVNLGVSFALDDFGTGYSSLTYFRRLPAQTLKIDQSFIRDMLADPEDLAIAQGVIGLAQAFQRTVIAEGVETAEHGTRLLEMGCYLAQGYGIARPMPASELPGWIENYRAPSVWTQART